MSVCGQSESCFLCRTNCQNVDINKINEAYISKRRLQGNDLLCYGLDTARVARSAASARLTAGPMGTAHRRAGGPHTAVAKQQQSEALWAQQAAIGGNWHCWCLAVAKRPMSSPTPAANRQRLFITKKKKLQHNLLQQQYQTISK